MRVLSWMCFILSVPFALISLTMFTLIVRDRYWPKGKHYKRFRLLRTTLGALLRRQ